MSEFRFGHCRVVEELGSGAISTVYRAVEEPLGRTVAVKALKDTIGTDSPFAAHLEREARVLADLAHPNVASLFGFVKSDRELFLVLEYIDGFNLSMLLAARPKQRPELVASVGRSVARGLAHAHERGVVHRDVKPSNILLSRRGDVKVIDFSIAQRDRLPSLDESVVNASKGPRHEAFDSPAFGTPAYMSPEQILGEFVDARSDLFSLGVVLYQMLAGVRPFDSGDRGDRPATGQRIRRASPESLRARAPDVPPALERIVMRLLEKAPADRFSSAASVAESLGDFLRVFPEANDQAIVSRALLEAGMVAASSLPSAVATAPRKEERTGLGSVALGLAALLALAVLGGVVLQAGSHSHETLRGTQPGLLLSPVKPGALRVVASPWATVWVDGQRMDVTPFARAIPLSAGTHDVTLTHPEAPSEKRVVTIREGHSESIDVVMKVHASSAAEDE